MNRNAGLATMTILVASCTLAIACAENEPVQPEDCFAPPSLCHISAACTLKDGICVNGGTKDCVRSRGCYENGECTHDPAATGIPCMATSDATCAASVGCEQWGDCAVEDKECRATKAEHCEQAKICKGVKCTWNETKRECEYGN